MWSRPGGRFGPPASSSLTEVLPARDSAQTTGPICFASPWVPPDAYNVSQPSFVSTGLQIATSFEMSLESPGFEPPDGAPQRILRGGSRQHPYRNERKHRKTLLPVVETLQSPYETITEIEPSRVSRSRQRRVTCVCAPYERRLLEARSSTDTRILSSHWIGTSVNQPVFTMDGSSLLTRNYLSGTDYTQREIANEPQSRLSSSSIPRSSSSASETERSPHYSTTSAVPKPNHLSSPTPDSITRSFNMNSPICDLQDQRSSESVDSEFSNHDRTADECSLFSSGSDMNLSPIISNRLCPLTLPTTPPPTLTLLTTSAHARHLAAKIIKHARHNKTPKESSMWCPNCGLFPVLPVTGPCGHTRCTKCIQDYGSCPCGTPAPKTLHVNTLIQDLVRKLLPCEPSARVTRRSDDSPRHRENEGRTVCRRLPLPSSASCGRVTRRGALRLRQAYGQPRLFPSATCLATDVPPHTPMSAQSRMNHARQLLRRGLHRQAAPQLARAAACEQEPVAARSARALLTQSITALIGSNFANTTIRRLTRELYHSVRLQAATTWLCAADLECVLCYHTYTRPVTTPCGHTYCRTCIERSMDYKKSCALCLRPLDDFNLAMTRETVFICAALASIDALNPPSPPDPDVIPIFVCTVAYPAIPCPLFIFDPRYWLMIRRVLESGSRKFGMVAYERDRTYSDYGTVLEVCDCVHLEDGRSILSTVGVSRFKVIERDVRDGCDVARIQPLTDITPTEDLVIWDLRIMATQISYKALLWLNTMNRTVRSEIETAFGQLPPFDYREGGWWEGPDGPAWLWWLIAILPLRSEIKVLILSTKNLLKRMMAVSRTLEAIDHVGLNAAGGGACDLQTALGAEDWLDRGG